jgi:hypothetical protein
LPIWWGNESERRPGTVKIGKVPNKPLFGARFASRPTNDRFVGLSWWGIKQGEYINRVKARLVTMDWKMIRAARQDNGPGCAALGHATWHLYRKVIAPDPNPRPIPPRPHRERRSAADFPAALFPWRRKDGA